MVVQHRQRPQRLPPRPLEVHLPELVRRAALKALAAAAADPPRSPARGAAECDESSSPQIDPLPAQQNRQLARAPVGKTQPRRHHLLLPVPARSAAGSLRTPAALPIPATPPVDSAPAIDSRSDSRCQTPAHKETRRLLPWLAKTTKLNPLILDFHRLPRHRRSHSSARCARAGV